ncbi:MAG: LysM peptidoglycan-binding domain-containing protein [Chloroflexi bacterium]|nr:LysM peptidoglycan-binding domain-containing protein [Chloroflexota bacterium]
MRQLFIFVLLSLLLVACRPDANGETETPDVTESLPAFEAEDSPRLEEPAPPTATTLPPTWTPVPMEHGGHLPGAAGSTGSGSSATITGTRVVYTVQHGDTLAQICHKYSVSISTVASVNHISNWDHIEVGQVLTIPVSGN